MVAALGLLHSSLAIGAELPLPFARKMPEFSKAVTRVRHWTPIFRPLDWLVALFAPLVCAETAGQDLRGLVFAREDEAQPLASMRMIEWNGS